MLKELIIDEKDYTEVAKSFFYCTSQDVDRSDFELQDSIYDLVAGNIYNKVIKHLDTGRYFMLYLDVSEKYNFFWCEEVYPEKKEITVYKPLNCGA